MKSQEDPITNDEWVLRRVHSQSFDSVNPPEINLYAFKPTVQGRFTDEGGISFYRQSCIECVQEILAKTDLAKRHRYGIVRLPLTYLQSIGLHVTRSDDDSPPIIHGHVLMPGINSIAYKNNKDEILPKMKALSDYVNARHVFELLPDSE